MVYGTEIMAIREEACGGRSCVRICGLELNIMSMKFRLREWRMCAYRGFREGSSIFVLVVGRQ